METFTITGEVPIVRTLRDLRRLTSVEDLAYRLYWQSQIDNENVPIEKYVEHSTSGALAYHWTDCISREQASVYAIYRFKQMPKMVELDYSDQLVGTIAVKTKNLCDESRHLITDQYDNGVNFNEDWCNYKELRELYIRLDGTKFEKEML